jgi:UDP-N-acetylmuramoyl-tripeptide--D-alanyl-D-alanine ligase
VMVPDRDAAVSVLRERLRQGDAVLVKASRGAALESIVETLQASFGGWTAGADAQGGARPTGEEVW